jgi:hypothetical protein
MTKFNQTYSTDLKYTEWQQISEFFPTFEMGRPPKWEKWQVADIAGQFSSVANGVFLLLELATRRFVAADQ